MSKVAAKVRGYVRKFRDELKHPGHLPLPTKSSIEEYIFYDLIEGYEFDAIGGAAAVFAWIYKESPNAGYVDTAVEHYCKTKKSWAHLKTSAGDIVAMFVIVDFVLDELERLRRGFT